MRPRMTSFINSRLISLTMVMVRDFQIARTCYPKAVSLHVRATRYVFDITKVLGILFIWCIFISGASCSKDMHIPTS